MYTYIIGVPVPTGLKYLALYSNVRYLKLLQYLANI